MGEKKLHPSVEKFKEFVKEHPNLVTTVRNGGNTWQDLFEDWYLLGEEDPKWDQYKRTGEVVKPNPAKEEDKGWVQQITGLLKNMDVNQVQGHIHSLSQAIGAVQGILMQFQGQSGESPPQTPERKNPFAFRKDWLRSGRVRQDTMQYIYSNRDLINFIREQPYWYRKLSRDPQQLKEMEVASLHYFQKTIPHKLEKFTNGLQMAQMMMAMLQTMNAGE